MSRTLLSSQSTLTALVCAVAALGLLCAASQASYVVASDDMESYSLGPIGTVVDYSDSTYGSANSSAAIVAGQALDLVFDLKSGGGVDNPDSGALNTNVSNAFPAAAVNNASTNLANYTLDFDLEVPTGSADSGFFIAVEIYSPGGFTGSNLYSLPAAGSGPTHYTWNMAADMSTPSWASPIDITSSSLGYRLVALGFPPSVDVAGSQLLLDNVVITNSVPEPTSLVLLGVALVAGIGLLRKQCS